MKTLAFYEYGMWKAQCLVDGCFDAVALHPEDKHGHPSPEPQYLQVCAKGHPLEIEAPPERLRWRIEQVLAQRPFEADRGWYPKGHPHGEMYGMPTGQSIDDLLREAHEVASFRAAQAEAKRAHLLEALSTFGVEVGPDGTFHGQILKGD